MNVCFIGGAGESHRVSGWNTETMVDRPRGLNLIRDAKRLKTPGLANLAISDVRAFARKELGSHPKSSGVVTIE